MAEIEAVAGIYTPPAAPVEPEPVVETPVEVVKPIVETPAEPETIVTEPEVAPDAIVSDEEVIVG